jgi:hypothetical protein
MSTTRGEIDWSLTTFEGVRREQLRQNLKLSLHDRLLCVEEMEVLSMQLHGDNYEKVLRQSYMSPDELRALQGK